MGPEGGEVPLKGLTPAEICEFTATAQRFLATAFDSVDDLLRARESVRNARRKDRAKSPAGAPSSSEQDVLRAAIVFSGAGIDATLKQLVKDALPELLEISQEAERHFRSFVVRDITANGKDVSPAALAELLISARPRDRLVEKYVYDLTGSSLQSTQQIQSTIGALGIEDEGLKKRVRQLDTMFKARNQIAHELDLIQVRSKGERTRNSRRVGATESMCQQTLDVAQQVLNAVTALLAPPVSASAAKPAKKSTVKQTALFAPVQQAIR